MSTIALELEPDEYLRIIRARLEMTQGQLAKLLGCPRQFISYYEHGVFKIPPAKMQIIQELANKEVA